MTAMPDLTHLSAAGQAHMVDVSGKPATERVRLPKEDRHAKGDARPRFIGQRQERRYLRGGSYCRDHGAKKTHDLIPLCHPLALTKVEVDLEADPACLA